MVTLASEALLIKVAGQKPEKDFRETTRNLRLVLSEAETASYRALERVFWPQELALDSLEYKQSVSEAFASPIYDTAAKEYFAAAHVTNPLILSVADRFLTEKIILCYLEGHRIRAFAVRHFAALMGSEHLSERIILAAFHKMDSGGILKVLDLVPDPMVTPEVAKRWMAKALQVPYVSLQPELATTDVVQRIRETHPEYEGFPDEWTLKVFCGG